MDKRTLRQEICLQRDGLTPEQIGEKSRRIHKRLQSLPQYDQAKTIMFFLTFSSEVDTRPMVEKCLEVGKTILVPKAELSGRKLLPSRLLNWGRDLEKGNYGIPEPRAGALRPVSPLEIDLLIVPGVAFDEGGNRLGYGGGYYDRFFPLLRPEVPLVALAFELQIKAALPVERWDRPVHFIITEERLITAGV